MALSSSPRDSAPHRWGDIGVYGGGYSLAGADEHVWVGPEVVGVVDSSPDYEEPADANDENIYEVTVEVSDEDENGNAVNTRRLETTITVTNLTD